MLEMFVVCCLLFVVCCCGSLSSLSSLSTINDHLKVKKHHYQDENLIFLRQGLTNLLPKIGDKSCKIF